MFKKIFVVLLASVAVFFCVFHTVSAHEVYVLNSKTVTYDIGHPSPNPLSLIFTDHDEFDVATVLGVILVIVVFLISVTKKVEDVFDPVLLKMKQYAPIIA